MNRIFRRPIIISSRCLEFNACRWNGAMIPDSFVRKLEPYVEFRPVCPEFEIGLGVPRDPIRIVRDRDEIRLVQPASGKDFTESMNAFSRKFLSAAMQIDGFILKGRSPSCGIKDVKFYRGIERSVALGKGPGFFGRAVLQQFPHAAIEDEGRLRNFRIREHFLTRIFALADWRNIEKTRSISKLIGFHADNKLLLTAYSQKELKTLGKIVANHDNKIVEDVVNEYGCHFRRAIANMPRNVSNINVIMHALGYFSESLTKKEKSHFLGILERYRKGAVPLSSPISVLQSWISRFGERYLSQQTYFDPYPEELSKITDTGRGRNH